MGCYDAPTTVRKLHRYNEKLSETEFREKHQVWDHGRLGQWETSWSVKVGFFVFSGIITKS